MSEILVTMRKEVGLSYFNSISNNEALAFFINDVSCNPIAKSNSMDAKFRIKMIKLELFIIDRTRFLWIKKVLFYIYYACIWSNKNTDQIFDYDSVWKDDDKIIPEICRKSHTNHIRI